LSSRRLLCPPHHVNILLDESLPRRLKAELAPHSVATVPEMGWAGLKNGDLLVRAQQQFELFITADQNLEYQQTLSTYTIATVILAARTTRIEDIRPLVPQLLKTIETARPGTVIRVG
jgi:Domain of unknown function (DUF5615)